MRLPNKVISYKESVFPKMISVLKVVNEGDLSVGKLYKKTAKDVGDVKDFIEVLDCLYALGKIDYDERRGVITLC